MTTTRGPLSAVPDALGGLDRAAVSEAARSATLAQNRAGAMRLEAACALVEHFRRDAEAREGSPADSDSDSDSGAGARRSRRGYARLDPQARARDHLVAACQLTCWHAARLVTAGVQVHTRLPRLRAVVGRGEVPEALAVDLACRLAEVPDAIVGDVEDEVTARIAEDLSGGDRPGRGAVESMIADAVARCDPDAARAATEAAVRARAVRFRRARAGMTTLWAVLPAEDAELLRLRIETDAATAAADGRRGGIDQLRADALVALAVYAATGAGAGAGAGGGGEVVEGIELGEVRAGADLPRPGLANAAAAGQPIRISVIAAAAQGLANRVEFVHGTYSGYEWLCRELLAGEQARVRFEVLDPAPGAMDGPEHALRYVITPAMAERIRLRDGTCRHPGCAVRAEDCDIDHVIAFNRREPQLGGPTMEWNLVCLCRKHHREKTFGTNSYRTGPLGELIIATDTGHEHRTRPTGPLARARDAILERHLDAWVDQHIGADGYLRNPPGAARNDWRRNRPA